MLPWQRERIDAADGVLPDRPGRPGARASALQELAERRGATAAQVALAWLIAQPGVLAIPKAVRETHLRENLAAADLELSVTERAAIDKIFPAPRKKTALAMR